MKQTRGQSLVALLIFVAVAAIVTTFAVNVVIVNSFAATSFEEGAHAWELAEAGAEEGLIRLLRNPAFIGTTLTEGSDHVTVTVTGIGNAKTIISAATVGQYVRTVTVSTSMVNNILSINTWREIF